MATMTRMTPQRQQVLDMLRAGCTLIAHAKQSRTRGRHKATLVWGEGGATIDTILISGGQVCAIAGGQPVVTHSRSISFTIVDGLQTAGHIRPVRNFNKGCDWVYALAEAGPNAVVPVVERSQWGG